MSGTSTSETLGPTTVPPIRHVLLATDLSPASSPASPGPAFLRESLDPQAASQVAPIRRTSPVEAKRILES